MYMPFFNDHFFEDRTEPASKPQTNRTQDAAMRTDIIETQTGYLIEMELPGFSKEELQVQLEDGYLTVSASHTASADNETAGRYLRRERWNGRYSRTFYVGSYLKQSDMKAKFESGLLTLSFPKEDCRKPEGPKYITID